jgi:hypothetical protein
MLIGYEKRLNQRTKFDSTVLYGLSRTEFSGIGDAHLYGLGVDISMDGIGLTFDREFKKGQILNIYFNVPSVEKDLSVLAEVIWYVPLEGYIRTGLRFLSKGQMSGCHPI